MSVLRYALFAAALAFAVPRADACDAHAETKLASSPVAGALAAKGSLGPGVPPKRVIVFYSGAVIDVTQFIIAAPDVCIAYHWHAANGVSVTALNGFVIPDPNPNACGYGVFGSVRVFEVFDTALPDNDFDGLPIGVDVNDFDADINDDGTPDGNTDTDGDGLDAGTEFWVTRTNSTLVDSDNDGIADGTEFLLATTARDFTAIPVIANLYQGSGATPQHVRDAIEQANIVLRQAKLIFSLVDVNENVNTGDDGSGGGTANDGNFTIAEGDKVVANGLTEAAALPTTKGFKVSFAGTPEVGSTTPAFSLHRKGSIVCSTRANVQLSGATIAHELFHVLTLDHPVAGSAEDTPGNIMTPSDGGRDGFVNSPDADKGIGNVTLTPGQLAQITADGIPAQIGVTATHNSPSRKRLYESGAVIDALADRSAGQPAYLELQQIQAASDETEDEIHVLVSLGGTFPASGNFVAVYRVLFDADSNAGTGAQGGVGFDVEAQITVTRGDLSGFVAIARRFGAGANRVPMYPAPAIQPITVRADSGSYVPRVAADLIELRLPKSELNLTGTLIPVRVIARNAEVGTGLNVDTADFVYDRQRYQRDPTLTLASESAGAGRPVTYTIAGLSPSTAFELRIDDTLVLSASTDGAGAYAGTLVAPAETARKLRFVTARDTTGRVALGGLLVQDGVFADGFE